MAEERQERILGCCLLAGAVWLGLHLFVGIRNIRDNLYMTFDSSTYVWIMAYAVALLVLDVLLYFLNSHGAAKSWARYWGFCSLVSGLLAVCTLFGAELGLWAVIPLLATPYEQFYPALMCLFSDGSVWNPVILFLLCGGHLVYFRRLSRKGRDA